MTTAKVFKNGRSQAIRLPTEFRVAGSEVQLKRVAEGILIQERECLGGLPPSLPGTVG